MAEAFVNSLGVGHYEAESAGLEPGTLNPLVVEAMREVGINISQAKAKGVAEMLARGSGFDYVITVCDQASAERCPLFPGPAIRLDWGFSDPSTLTGSHEARLAAVRTIRNQIREQVAAWLAEDRETNRNQELRAVR